MPRNPRPKPYKRAPTVSKAEPEPLPEPSSTGDRYRTAWIRWARISGVATIFLLAAFLRFYHLGTAPRGLHGDEAIDAIDAAEAARTGQYAVFYPGNNGREGLSINTGAFFLSLFASIHRDQFRVRPWMARFPSALFGTWALLCDGYTPERRQAHNIHFVTTAEEAARVKQLPKGTAIWPIVDH